jgi:hypothetical protein
VVTMSEDEMLQASLDRDVIVQLILRLARDITEGHADPEDNLEAEADVRALANQIGNMSALHVADGIQTALLYLFVDWGLEGST